MKKTRKLISVICGLLVALFLALILAFVGVGIYSRKVLDISYDEKLFQMAKNESYTEYYADSGIYEYIPGKISEIALGGYKKQWVAIGGVSEYLVNGFIAMEDRSFFEHSGVNLKRTLYAAANTVFNFKSTFGASTITQQVIKNVSGDNALTLKRKFNEIIRAYNLEKNHTKSEILELYLNIVPMGNNMVGICDASRKYFAKEPDALTLSEAATLVGITNAPTKYDPYTNEERCLEKRNAVIGAMLDFGVISEDEYEKAINESLNVIPKQDEESESWFIETVNAEVTDDLCDKYSISKETAAAMLRSGGLKIYTTQKSYVQKILEDYFENEENFPDEIKRGLEFAMAICDSENGDLVAIVGSVGKKEGNRLLNHALVPHTPGSALKPVALYAPLIDDGTISWSTVFDDVPLSFNDKNGVLTPYPMNCPNVYAGLTTVKDALRLSKNTVAMQLYNILGAEKIFQRLKYVYGFDTVVRREYNSRGDIITDLASAPLALGQLSYGVPLRKLTEAYTSFSSEGVLYSGKSYLKVVDSDGNVILENGHSGERVYSKEGARLINTLLSNVTDSGTASKIKLKEIVDTAGKTGTSGDDRDRLFIGYTPYFCAGIWCGYSDGGKSIGHIAPTHLKIWDDIMIEIHSVTLSGKSDGEIKVFSSEGLIKREYCKDSGRLFSPNCAKDARGCRLESGYFLRGFAPSGLCDRHVCVQYDTSTGAIANHSCPHDDVKTVSLLRIPERSFARQVVVLDAEYMFMPVESNIKLPESYEVPYFYYMIPEGEFVGIGAKRKQFNSYCYLHDG